MFGFDFSHPIPECLPMCIAESFPYFPSFSLDHESEGWSNAIIIESLLSNCSENVFDGYTIFCESLAFIQVSVYDTS